MTSFVMPPPYQHTADPTPPAALGAILFHDLDGAPDAVAIATRRQRASPWCAACLRIEPGAEFAAAEFVYETAAMPGVIPAGSSRCLPDSAALLRAVDQRRAPTIEAIADYVVRRLGCHQLRDLLLDAMGCPEAGNAHPRTVRRRLGALGRLRPWEWRRLAGLAALNHRADLTLEALARAAETEPRTLRRWIRGLLGVSTTAYRRWPGWEWIVEAGLRRGGYFAVSTPARPLGTIGVSPSLPALEHVDVSRHAAAGVPRHAPATGPLADGLSLAGRG